MKIIKIIKDKIGKNGHPVFLLMIKGSHPYCVHSYNPEKKIHYYGEYFRFENDAKKRFDKR